ncbi:MAG: DUF3014 domain-containing protein [Halioglobus sp.]
MRADPDEYAGSTSSPSRFPVVELLIAAALIAGLVAFWFWSEEDKPTQTVVELPPIAATPSQPMLPVTPDIPQRTQPAATVLATASTPGDGTQVDTPEPAKPAPLSLEQGDAIVRRQAAAIGANKLANTENPLEISAALIDGLSRGLLLRKMLPADPPKEAFSVVENDESLYISTASYTRYDAVTDAVTALDSDMLVNTFHTLRPLYEQAYEHLGLDAGDFDNAVIRTLDLVLATPEIGEPIEVKPKSVVYVFADPSLESLPAVQKLLIRMGPDNLRQIKQQARLLREGLLAR